MSTDWERRPILCTLKKFRSYLFGSNKWPQALLASFNESRAVHPQASGRIMGLDLGSTWIHPVLSSDQQHKNADAMSHLWSPRRLPTSRTDRAVGRIIATQIRMWTRRNPFLSPVSCYLKDGRTDRDQLNLILVVSTNRTFSLWGSNIIIPPPDWEVVLGELHARHLVISECLCGGQTWSEN